MGAFFVYFCKIRGKIVANLPRRAAPHRANTPVRPYEKPMEFAAHLRGTGYWFAEENDV
jgi:hypothetical protein